MIEPVTPSVGWGVLHLFCKVKPEADGEAILIAVKAAQGDDHQVVTFAVLGHKADLGFLAIGPGESLRHHPRAECYDPVPGVEGIYRKVRA